MSKKRSTEGIEVRHGRSCPALEGGQCRCEPPFRAEVYSKRDGKKIRKTFATASAARAWRADATTEISRGRLRATSTPTLTEAAKVWLAGARDGSVRQRSGDLYKPSVLRGYAQALENCLVPELGAHKLSDIAIRDVQDLADRLLGEGRDPSTIRNQLMPLRAIYRRAIARGEVSLNPTAGLELAAVRGKRDRCATPTEARELLDALPPQDRAIWATAFYGGLRLGELRALRWEDIDLAGGVVRVTRSWDPRVGPIAPKSRSGTRNVPIPAVLSDYLVEHKQATGRAEGLAFGRTAATPFSDTALVGRARRVWIAADLETIGLHEARHTFASLMIAAGVNAKALSTYLGHANISITMDRYGHLMPGNEAEAAGLLDAYLQRSDTAARVAQLA